MRKLNYFNDFINEGAGIRNIAKLAKLHRTAEIYFHKDLDGVTSALAMKGFLKTYYDIETVETHIIQYGGLEYAIKSHHPDNLAVLVDFAHGKPMFHIQSDHHDSQVGAEETTSTYFKPARSNVEIISGEISHSDIFPKVDIELIKTVDSADFYRTGISPEDVQKSIFKISSEKTGSENRFIMGFVVNRLLLAYKNKRITVTSLDGKREHVNKNILECLVLDSNPSLLSIFLNLKHYIKNASVSDKLGFLANPKELRKNLDIYTTRMKDYSFVEDEEGETYQIGKLELKVLSLINGMSKGDLNRLATNLKISTDELEKIVEDLLYKKYIFFNERWGKYNVGNFGKKVLSGKRAIKGVHLDEDYNILIQYGGGYMVPPGSYDRYVPFKNYPEADFLCIVWPMGLIQISCNPFKEKKLKDISLIKISNIVLEKWRSDFEKIYIPLESIKYEFETSQDWKKMKKEEGEFYRGVGFKFSDLSAFYKNDVVEMVNGRYSKVDINFQELEDAMDSVYEDLDRNQKNILSNLYIPLWDIITRNSGGHPSISNISGIGFLKYDKTSLRELYGTDKYTDVMKKMARQLTDRLKFEINSIDNDANVKYDGDLEIID